MFAVVLLILIGGAAAQVDFSAISGVWQIVVGFDHAWEYDFRLPDAILFSDVNLTSRALTVVNGTTRFNVMYDIDSIQVSKQGRLEMRIFSPFAPRDGGGARWTFESGEWNATRLVGTEFNVAAAQESPLDFVRTTSPVVYANAPAIATTTPRQTATMISTPQAATTATTRTSNATTSSSLPAPSSLDDDNSTVLIAAVAGGVGGAVLIALVAALALSARSRRRATATASSQPSLPAAPATFQSAASSNNGEYASVVTAVTMSTTPQEYAVGNLAM